MAKKAAKKVPTKRKLWAVLTHDGPRPSVLLVSNPKTPKIVKEMLHWDYNGRTFFSVKRVVASECYAGFKRYTGITLTPGKATQISIKVVK